MVEAYTTDIRQGALDTISFPFPSQTFPPFFLLLWNGAAMVPRLFHSGAERMEGKERPCGRGARRGSVKRKAGRDDERDHDGVPGLAP